MLGYHAETNNKREGWGFVDLPDIWRFPGVGLSVWYSNFASEHEETVMFPRCAPVVPPVPPPPVMIWLVGCVGLCVCYFVLRFGSEQSRGSHADERRTTSFLLKDVLLPDDGKHVVRNNTNLIQTLAVAPEKGNKPHPPPPQPDEKQPQQRLGCKLHACRRSGCVLCVCVCVCVYIKIPPPKKKGMIDERVVQTVWAYLHLRHHQTPG
jgi:hypothetical protein